MGQTSDFKQNRSVTGANVCVTQRYLLSMLKASITKQENWKVAKTAPPKLPIFTKGNLKKNFSGKVEGRNRCLRHRPWVLFNDF